jgi:hypothetical protein
VDHAALRLWWADAGYRLSISAQDPADLSDYNRMIGVNGYELISAGSSLAVRESQSAMDLLAAAVWRWEHPQTHANEREKDVGSINVGRVTDQALRQWVTALQQDVDVGRAGTLTKYRHLLTHRAPVRGVTLQIGEQGTQPLIPPTLHGVGVDQRGREAVRVSSRWYVDFLYLLRQLT